MAITTAQNIITNHRRYADAPMSHVSLKEAVQAGLVGHQVAAGRWGTEHEH
jgi:hypothetical protein